MSTSDLSSDAVEWIERYAAALGVSAPSVEEIGELLDLAGAAARASHRQAAPVACWLAARAAISPAEGLARAQALGA